MADEFGFVKILTSKKPIQEIESDLKKRYRILAKEMHPDKPGNKGKDEAFALMKDAYEKAKQKLKTLKANPTQAQARARTWTPPDFGAQRTQRAQAPNEAAREAFKEPPRKPVTPKFDVDYFDVFGIQRESSLQQAVEQIRQSMQNPSALLAKGHELADIQRMGIEGIGIFSNQTDFIKLIHNLKERGIITYAQFETSLGAYQQVQRNMNRRNPYANCFSGIHEVGKIIDIRI